MSKRQSVLSFVVWLLIPFAAATVGARFGPGEWYAQLAKPAWNPPGYVFGPVWTILYAMMGIAAWFVWREHGPAEAKLSFGLFFAQLILNACWTYLFFGLQAPGLALMEILLLWVFILLTLVAFWRIKPLAGVLLIPYLGWVTFAATLNYQLWVLNR